MVRQAHALDESPENASGRINRRQKRFSAKNPAEQFDGIFSCLENARKSLNLNRKISAGRIRDMEQYRILVVEDDPAIRRGMCDALENSGYKVCPCADGNAAAEAVRTEIFDLALLDVVLPGKSGFEILEILRRERAGTPAIMLTAVGGEAEKVRGLKLGADDYVVKPFSIVEVLARIEAVLRRSPERPKNLFAKIRLPAGELDTERREIAFPNGEKKSLTEKEFLFLRHVATHAGRIVSREEILTRVWEMDPRLVETRTIDTTLMRLREKLGEENSAVIETVRGRGYTWKK